MAREGEGGRLDTRPLPYSAPPMTPRRRRKSAPPELHELESLVMESVWKQDEASVREVLEELNRGLKQRAYTTVMTIMLRLEEKGLLARRREGKRDVYSPVLSREEYMNARAEAEVDALVAEFGDAALVRFAERVDGLDAERLRKLRRLAGRD